MMTRNHFRAIASLLASLADTEQKAFVVSGLCETFKRDNPLFNADKFRDACKQANNKS